MDQAEHNTLEMDKSEMEYLLQLRALASELHHDMGHDSHLQALVKLKGMRNGVGELSICLTCLWIWLMNSKLLSNVDSKRKID